MKVCLGFAFAYMFLGMLLGVFAREYTKRKGLNSAEAKKTNLMDLHSHTFTLGMIIFLIAAAFGAISNSFAKDMALFVWFLVVYNIGVLGTVFMLLVRGVAQVTDPSISKKKDRSIFDTAGFFHITTFVGFILFFCLLLNCI